MESRLQSGEDIEMCDTCIKLEYPDRTRIEVVTAEIEFTGAISIDLGGAHCEIREFIAPHSGDSVLIHVPEERVVFIGDADSGDYYQNNGEYDKARLKEMIRVLEELDVDLFALGHGAPQSKLEVVCCLKRLVS
jgi:glyoxylase-like metal-dependent hydrolase (beta-lactamase superfamily II)